MIWRYVKKCLHIYMWNILQWINRRVLHTYPLIEECVRCRDCGRNVHDYDVPNKLWLEVIGPKDGVWCYDCFCNRVDKKFGIIEDGILIKNLMIVKFEWRLKSGEKNGYFNQQRSSEKS